MPQTFEKMTLSDIRMLHEKAKMTGDPVRKLLPISRPKNCEYHSTPAKAQNSRLLTSTEPRTPKYSPAVRLRTFCQMQ